MPNQKKIVFTTIQRFLYNNGIKNENNYLLVKKSLLKMIKLYPKRVDFNEILIWFFMQDKKYKLALSQVISLDRRTNNALTNIYEIGETLLDLGKYKLAIEAFEYIIERGFNSNIYIDAQINRLYALTKSIEDKSKDVKIIDNKYSEVIAEVGVHRFSVLLLSNHAHFKAFFLNDLKSATKILEEVMKIKLIDRLDLA
mgnify:FL=1